MDRELLRIEGWLELGAHDDAIVEGSRLLEAGCKRWELRYLMGRALLESGKFEAALEHYLAARPAAPDPQSVLLDMGWCHKRLGRLDLAIADLEALLACQPASAIGHYNLACYLALSGEPERCLERLARALELDKSFAAELDSEADFDSVRGSPVFESLCHRGRERRS
jgi:tetratricopeptide (TPR) repeat protein